MSPCNSLQHTAACCNTLHHTLQRTFSCHGLFLQACNPRMSPRSLQHTATHCIAQQHTQQHTLEHTQQHTLQHTQQHTQQHTLQHILQHTLQHALQRNIDLCPQVLRLAAAFEHLQLCLQSRDFFLLPACVRIGSLWVVCLFV